MVQSEPVRDFGLRALAETVAVAHAEGRSAARNRPWWKQALRLAETMPQATSSMAQDMARGRPTEIDSLNGYVARRGEALGIDTPVNEILVAMIKLLEESVIKRPLG